MRRTCWYGTCPNSHTHIAYAPSRDVSPDEWMPDGVQEHAQLCEQHRGADVYEVRDALEVLTALQRAVA